jgi:PAS domain S-box-containing protein
MNLTSFLLQQQYLFYDFFIIKPASMPSSREISTRADRIYQLHQRISEIAHIGIWEFDLVNKTLWWSDITRSIHEVEDDFEPRLETAINFYPEGEDRERLSGALKEAIEGGVSYDIELRLCTAKGNTRWARTHGKPYRENGITLRVDGTIQDITEAVELRQQLQRERDFNRNLLENLNSAVSMISGNGILLDVNAALCKMTGFTKEELIGHKQPYPYWHPDDHAHILRSIAKVHAGDFSPYQYRFVHKNGRSLWMEVVPSMTKDTVSGETFLHFALSDVTERKVAEEALQASEMRFKEILQGVETVAVQGYALDGTVRYWNHAATLLYGYSQEEALGRNLLDLIIPPDIRSAVDNEIRKMAETKQPIPASELTLMRKDGSPVTVFSSHSLVQVPGQEREFFCIDIDLSERKRAEVELLRIKNRLESKNFELQQALSKAEILTQKAESANVAKAQFLANISHELHTPMNGILGMIQLLKDTSLEPEQRQYADIIQKSGDDLLRIIDAILHYTDIDSGKIQIKREPFNLIEFIDLLAAGFRPLAEEKCLCFELIKDPRLPAEMNGDSNRIRQILSHFLTNALKFTRQGSITLRVEKIAGETHQTDAIRFTVEDTGVGIPASKLDAVFDRFNQVDNSLTRQFGGMGLGLTITNELVALMNGKIGVQSADGKGSQFYCTIPV